MCYVDFKKAFDSVWRSGLWKAMRFLGYEDKIVRLLEALYYVERNLLLLVTSASDLLLRTIKFFFSSWSSMLVVVVINKIH